MATSTIGAHLTLTGARTLYWTVVTDVAVTGTPAVAIIGSYAEPDASTVWHDASWTGAETVNGNLHTRTMSLLVAGPSGPTVGGPYVIPTAGEYSTWVRLPTATDRVEIEADLLTVG